MTVCSGCYNSFSGWWCDNCDTWPCKCLPEAPQDFKEGDPCGSAEYWRGAEAERNASQWLIDNLRAEVYALTAERDTLRADVAYAAAIVSGDARWEGVQELRRYKAAVAAVRDQHWSASDDPAFCGGCALLLPCPTIAALNGHLTPYKD